MDNAKQIQTIKNGMLLQDNRGTSYPIFIVVENKKIYGMDSDYSDGRERKNSDGIEIKKDLCEDCHTILDEDGEMPEECDNGECDESFVNYKIEEDVPNMRAAFFFTAQACNEHIEQNRHHYNSTAHSYAISAYHNSELRSVLVNLIGESNEHKLR